LTITFNNYSSDSDGTITSQSWSFGDGTTSTAKNPTHTYSSSGIYSVKLTVTDNDGASDALTKSVTVLDNSNQAPTAGFSSSALGLTVNFTDASTDSDGTIASRSWNFGDGGVSTSTNPSHTYAAGGSYNVTLTVTDNTFSKSVTVLDDPNQAPTAGFTYSILDLKVNYINTSADSDGTIASQSWNFDDGGVSTSTNPSHTYATGGSYTVRLTVTDNDGASNTFSKSVTVIDPNQAPEAPTNLTASSEKKGKGKTRINKVTLSWKDNSNNETEFVIERCGVKGNQSCNFYEWMILPEETALYQFESTSSYKYRVKARKDQINSKPSNEVKG
jgi:PKD repeat protein